MRARAVILIAVLLHSCTASRAYQAAEHLSAGERAHLLGSEIANATQCASVGPGILFSSVDGTSTYRYFGYDNGCPYPSELLLKPGKHTIGVYHFYGASPSFHLFCFVAEAQQTYKVKRTITGYSITFYATVVDPAGNDPDAMHKQAEGC